MFALGEETLEKQQLWIRFGAFVKTAFGFKFAEKACRLIAGQPVASLPSFPPLPLAAEQWGEDAGDPRGCPELGKHTVDPPKTPRLWGIF